jgi:hypothetical protein
MTVCHRDSIADLGDQRLKPADFDATANDWFGDPADLSIRTRPRRLQCGTYKPTAT